MNSEQLTEKVEGVRTILRGRGKVVVAYSGGVDSTLLAKLARDVLGKANAPAVTADSPSLAREDLLEARRVAQALDLEHAVIRTTELDDPRYRANTAGRCYVCKHTLFEALEAVAASRGIATVAYGAIGDDLLDERPGEQAARRHGVLAPLQEAGLTKPDVRELARTLGLPNWDKPQNACLSSRIPHGLEVTVDKLRQVELAEAFLRRQGFRQVRVRHLGTHARIEVEPASVARLQDQRLRVMVEERLRAIGFDTVAVDPQGYRRGGATLLVHSPWSTAATSQSTVVGFGAAA